MNRQKFIDGNLNTLIERDVEIQGYFRECKEQEQQKLKDDLSESLGLAYDKYASEYFSSKGLGSYFSTFLRTTGAAADLAGTYLFWAMGGAGFGLKGIGLLEKTVADAIDAKHYQKYAEDGLISKEGAKIGGETLVERVAAYLPLGVGEIADLLRGSKKYDNSIMAKALYHAKNEFIKKVGEYKQVETDEPRIIPIDKFKNPDYQQPDVPYRKAA